MPSVQEGRAGGQGWLWAPWSGIPGPRRLWEHSVPWAAPSAGQVAILCVTGPGCQVLSEAGRTVVRQAGPSVSHTECHLPWASPPAPGSVAQSLAGAAGSLPGTPGSQEAPFPTPVLPALPRP